MWLSAAALQKSLGTSAVSSNRTCLPSCKSWAQMVAAMCFSSAPCNVSMDPTANKLGHCLAKTKMKLNFWELLIQVQEQEFLTCLCFPGQSHVAITVFSYFWSMCLFNWCRHADCYVSAEDGNFQHPQILIWSTWEKKRSNANTLWKAPSSSKMESNPLFTESQTHAHRKGALLVNVVPSYKSTSSLLPITMLKRSSPNLLSVS